MDPMDTAPSITTNNNMFIVSDHRSTPPILTMPIEILARISHLLKTKDFCNVRLTCRGLEQALFNDFADDFFSRKQFMASEFSLGALVDIAKSRLGWTMKHVNLSVDHVPFVTSLLAFRDEDKRVRLHELKAQQLNIWSSGLANHLLAEAFRHLRNLDSVVIRDFNSFTRFRDGPRKAWKSYGARTMQEQCGVEPVSGFESGHDVMRETDHVGQLFTAVLNSLGTANARPRSIKIYERKGNRLDDTAFYIPRPIEAKITPVLANLKELHLCIRETLSFTEDSPYNHYFLRKFLAYCPNLEELRINAHCDNLDASVRDTFRPLHQWLAASPPAAADSTSSDSRPAESPDPQSPPPVAFPRLRTFSLGGMATTANDILAIIRKFAPTLNRLELWKVVIGPSDASGGNPIAGDNIFLWRRFFRKLLEIPGLDLHEMMVGRLRQYYSHTFGPTAIRDVKFLKSTNFIEEDGAIKGNEAVDHKGSDMKDFIRGITMMFNADLDSYERWRYQNDALKNSTATPDDGQQVDTIDIAAHRRQAEMYIHRVRMSEDDTELE